MTRGQLLTGVKVVDFSEQVPGPHATRLLTGLGADVVKIERPDEGDRLRARPALFESQNRGKRSLAIDLKDERGRRTVLDLVAAADVVVEGYRPGVMDRLGLGFDDLTRINPRLIYASISGFGASGPYRNRPGHDFQYLSYVGAIPAPPSEAVAGYVPTTLPVADLGAALYAELAIVLALYERLLDPDGFRGRHLDVAMSDCALAMMEPRIAEALTVATTAEALRRPGYGVFETGDGRLVTIGALEDHFWTRLATALSLPELLDDRYATFADRREHVERIDAVLRARVAAFDQDELLKLLLEHDVPVAPVNDLHQPIEDAHFLARGMVVTSSTPPGTRVSEWPVALDVFADRDRLTSAPAIGEHTADVLAEAGLSTDDIAELRAAGVVRMA
jgi:crotonobetainyl-CoA:carnitine CoA-transferase CaiB-like acyl-CoA transferase